MVVRAAEAAPAGFDARRSATGRRYRYTVRNHPVADPFSAGTAWHVARPLDLGAMRLACDPLYRGARLLVVLPAAGRSTAPSLVRVVRDADWVDLGDGMLRFEIEASSFCQQMVRPSSAPWSRSAWANAKPVK